MNKLIGPDQLRCYWFPVLALEDEYVFEAKDNGPTGNIIRFYRGATIQIFPWFKAYMIVVCHCMHHMHIG